MARGEAREGRDVDILVDFGAPVTLFEYIRSSRATPSSHNCVTASSARLCVDLQDAVGRRLARPSASRALDWW